MNSTKHIVSVLCIDGLLPSQEQLKRSNSVGQLGRHISIMDLN